MTIIGRLRIGAFSLAETKAYLDYKKCRLNNAQVTLLYMCIGGIPFYLNLVEKGLSSIQAVNALCFNKKGALAHEFDLLFASLFKHHESHEAIIRMIAKKREGVSRESIETALELKGGRLTKRLRELEEAGFIASVMLWKKERGIYYKIIDEFTLFYLTWVEKNAEHRVIGEIDDHLWTVLSQTPAWRAWSGYAFEAICFKHLDQIKKALHIPYGSEAAHWKITSSHDTEHGAQIDLVFDRPDNCITLCEIKYCQTPFVLDKAYANHLLKREAIYVKATDTHKQIFHSLIASGGVKKNLYSESVIASIATLEDLFKT